MAAKDSYDVLRLIGHGKNSYVSSENVMGTPLILLMCDKEVIEV